MEDNNRFLLETRRGETAMSSWLDWFGVKTGKRSLSPAGAIGTGPTAIGTGPTVAEQDCQEEEKDQVKSQHARVEPVHVRTCWNLEV